MKDEIKEILDRLERIDHKEYSGGFEFADSGSFDEDCRCFEERKKLANYITNLQEEKCKAIHTSIVQKKQLTNKLNKLTNKYNDLQKANERLKENAIHNDKVVDKAKWNEMLYKSRIEKAIEYINTHYLNANEPELLSILQGVGKDE